MSNINALSEQLLLAVKTEQPVEDLQKKIKRVSLPYLEQQLSDDTHKKAFWLNIYNAFFQILRKSKNLKKPAIFRERHIHIAGQAFSLDDIEHGILRRYRYKYSLGYFANPFARSLIKKLAVEVLDYRIHFAMNCGAKSCPPIAFYTADNLERQLELATLTFLTGETDIKEQAKEAHVTRLFQWFLKDFGGPKGVRKILNERFNKDFQDFKLVYKEYSWEEQLDNYNEAQFAEA
jgi:hypothetical protein